MAGLTKNSARLQSSILCSISISSRCLSSRTVLRQSSYAPEHPSSEELSLPVSTTLSHPPPNMPRAAPLSILPLNSIIRSLAITSISSSRVLLTPSLAIMSKLAHSQSPILSPDTNPVLRYFLKKTFYRQFCAGENAAEVKQTVDGLKSIGFKGVILGYAREVVMEESQSGSLESSAKDEAAEACIRDEIIPWARGTLETVRIASPGDYVALKFTGAGSQALYDLSHQTGPSPALKEAIDSICDLAAARDVRLLFDAEQQAVQAGIDMWTLNYMRKYNKQTPGKAVVYGTYQAYLKATPSILASHLAAAQKDGFTLGVKLVRGAYLGSDPRHLIHDTKADTDNAYNGIAASLAQRSYGPVLRPAQGGDTTFPPVNVVLAGHNHTSVRKIQALRTEQAKNGEEQTELVYAQLQGMADEVSCELVQAGKAEAGGTSTLVDIPKAYKYLVWGTTGECMKYLLRRAQENKDAVQRTRDGRNAMAGELLRRVKAMFVFAS
ncbi:putative proline dehydrogenase [Lachnellula suecica]|uniref:Proline dehydrogenase n=1 Tax=Lachnellula suecica TaxID=602035 RepID=A0A8T9BTW9_9HELO|nr:putative proline dehydrogenase [Lachnellula suecica]